jgi:arylsulfatase A-like enzyme
MGIANNTILWFCSDNGAQRGGVSSGGLRGKKADLWEGGIRVPGILEWPAQIKRPFRTDIPCVTSDMYPTITDILGIKARGKPEPIDGISLVPLIEGKMKTRPKPIAFWDQGKGHLALIDNDYKFHLNPRLGKKANKKGSNPVLLYNLKQDLKESVDLVSKDPQRAKSMQTVLEKWKQSVQNSMKGADYPKAMIGK